MAMNISVKVGMNEKVNICMPMNQSIDIRIKDNVITTTTLKPAPKASVPKTAPKASIPKTAPKSRPLTPTPKLVPAMDTGERRRILSCNEQPDVTVGIQKLQATNKMPPNWEKHHQQTLREQLTFRTFCVSSTSTEHSVIRSLLDPVRIISVEQIVNPSLWDKFDQQRKDMVKSKSNDATTLSDIGLTNKQMEDVLHYSKAFPIHPRLADVPYNDNMNLLFHCTRNSDNINSILTSGLDERMCYGGYLGRGLYFADNPLKSMSYDKCGIIFICAVLLGDCLSMNEKRDKDLVREPEKCPIQRRNFNDLFFDSIVGRPGINDNEYVLYNRHQCLPLYMVKYEKPSSLNYHDVVGSYAYVEARKVLPSFCWKAKEKVVPLPSLKRLEANNWPNYSNKIFEKMGVDTFIEKD